MGLFSRKRITVRVKGGDPSQPPPTYDPSKSNFPGYAYRWELKTSPAVGQWLVVPGMGADWVGAIVSIDKRPSPDATKAVRRVATPADIRRALKQQG